MKYPCLVPKSLCKTPIHIEIYQERMTKYGEPLETIVVDCMCNYQDNAKTVFTKDKKLVELVGTAYIPGDIAPMLANISGGIVVVNGEQRDISTGTKARNPDNSVNFTKIEVK